MAFVERKLENIVWDAEGQKIEGQLLRIAPVKYSDGVGLKYKVQRKDGVMVVFRGATDLDAKLSSSDVGSNVYIEYVGEDSSRTAKVGMSLPKVFKVMVDASAKQQVPATAKADEMQITDDDIPF